MGDDEREGDVLIKTVVAGSSQSQSHLLIKEATALYGMVRQIPYSVCSAIIFVTVIMVAFADTPSCTNSNRLHVGRHVAHGCLPVPELRQLKAVASTPQSRWTLYARPGQHRTPATKGHAAPAQKKDSAQGHRYEELLVSSVKHSSVHLGRTDYYINTTPGFN